MPKTDAPAAALSSPPALRWGIARAIGAAAKTYQRGNRRRITCACGEEGGAKLVCAAALLGPARGVAFDRPTGPRERRALIGTRGRFIAFGGRLLPWFAFFLIGAKKMKIVFLSIKFLSIDSFLPLPSFRFLLVSSGCLHFTIPPFFLVLLSSFVFLQSKRSPPSLLFCIFSFSNPSSPSKSV